MLPLQNVLLYAFHCRRDIHGKLNQLRLARTPEILFQRLFEYQSTRHYPDSFYEFLRTKKKISIINFNITTQLP
jgi:hypothetical protein